MRLRPFLAAALFLAGCGRTITEKEPNDHFTSATAIKADGMVKGALSSASDVDVFKLEITQESGSLSLYIGGIRDADFVISVQDKDRQEIKRFDETSVGGDEEATDIGLSRGIYYIALSNKNPKFANSAQGYEMRVKTEPDAGREREPNDKPLTANPLHPGGLTRGHYFPSQNLLAEEGAPEEDWYRVDVEKPGPQILNIEVSEVVKIDPLLEIYDANSYKIKEAESASGESVSLRNFGVKGPVQYYLRLRAKTPRAANPNVPYELLTEILPYDGKTEFEPNDQRSDAAAFAQNSITGNIHPAGDADWYKIAFDTDSKRILRLELSAVQGMDLQMVLADELGHPLLTIDNMEKEQGEVLTGIGAAPGGYYLIVSEKTKKMADNHHAYTLVQSLMPFQEGLEYEPNDGSDSSQALKVGGAMDGYIAPKGDVDWYEFNVYKKGNVVFEVTGLLNARLALTLHDQDNKEIHEETAKSLGDALSFSKALPSGTYSIKLRAADPQQNNVRDKYSLRLRMQ